MFSEQAAVRMSIFWAWQKAKYEHETRTTEVALCLKVEE